jgi:hypothetical protein
MHHLLVKKSGVKHDAQCVDVVVVVIIIIIIISSTVLGGPWPP